MGNNGPILLLLLLLLERLIVLVLLHGRCAAMDCLCVGCGWGMKGTVAQSVL